MLYCSINFSSGVNKSFVKENISFNIDFSNPMYAICLSYLKKEKLF